MRHHNKKALCSSRYPELRAVRLSGLVSYLGHFQVGSYSYRSLVEGYMPYGSLIEALYTLNSPPVVSFKVRAVRFRFRGVWGLLLVENPGQ